MLDIKPETVVDERYQIVSRIGSGGMADVYCAEDLQLGRKVALKLLYRRFAEDSEFVERFRREASSAAGLQHPNVVGVYDRGEWDGTYYIAMEYLEGQSLKQLILERAPLPPLEAIEIAIQVLKAARFAHQRGIIHRDIKPHNVILDDEQRAKVTDFGIARAGASDMTETGSIMGTAQYLSPEQAQGHAVSATSDLYSIGVMLYELLAGRVPFEGDSAVTIALKHVSEAPVPPSAYSAAVPPELDAVVLRALEKDPSRRFASAEEFIGALEQARARIAAAPPGERTASFPALPVEYPATTAVDIGGDTAIEPFVYPDGPLPPPPERQHRRRWPAVVAILLLLAGGVAAFALTRPERRTTPDIVGQPLQAASAVLQNAGFEVQVQRVTSDAPRERVLRQDPQPGARVDKGSTVTLSVSNGPGEALLPDVEGLSQKEAARRLRASGFKVHVQEESSDTVEKGQATRTLPSAGQQVERGTRITLLVSSGPERVKVPDVVGQQEDSATAELENAGFKVVIERKESKKDPGSVLSQTPGADVEADKGSVVKVTVAEEAKSVTVPSVVGHDQGDAASTLSALGLTVVFDEQPVATAGQDGVVLSQRPPAGAKVKRGSRVTIVVGRFNPSVNPEGTPPSSAPSPQ